MKHAATHRDRPHIEPGDMIFYVSSFNTLEQATIDEQEFNSYVYVTDYATGDETAVKYDYAAGKWIETFHPLKKNSFQHNFNQ